MAIIEVVKSIISLMFILTGSLKKHSILQYGHPKTSKFETQIQISRSKIIILENEKSKHLLKPNYIQPTWN